MLLYGHVVYPASKLHGQVLIHLICDRCSTALGHLWLRIFKIDAEIQSAFLTRVCSFRRCWLCMHLSFRETHSALLLTELR